MTIIGAFLMVLMIVGLILFSVITFATALKQRRAANWITEQGQPSPWAELSHL